jgi:hypothetical protein
MGDFNSRAMQKEQLFKIFKICEQPDQTLSLKGDCCNGRKYFKGSMMVLLACTAVETDKLVPLVIVKGEIHGFKNVTNRRPWVKQAMSTGYSRELDATVSSQNRKISLLMNQCATHHRLMLHKVCDRLMCYSPPRAVLHKIR